MVLLQLACLVIVSLFVLLQDKRHGSYSVVVGRYLLLAFSAWIAEQSVLWAYDFYHYDPSWNLFVGRVPLLVVLIWPAVIESAGEIASALLAPDAGRARRAVVAALFVIADASLIETISVHSRLWQWHHPGILGVPPIGILGWGIFAGLCNAVLPPGSAQQGEQQQQCVWSKQVLIRSVLLLLIPSTLLHPLLVGCWWGVFRWVDQPVSPWPAIVVLWIVATSVALLFWVRRFRNRIPLAVMLIRIPATLFFLVLLLRFGRAPAIFFFAAAFVLPYVTLIGSDRSSIGSNQRIATGGTR